MTEDGNRPVRHVGRVVDPAVADLPTAPPPDVAPASSSTAGVPAPPPSATPLSPPVVPPPPPPTADRISQPGASQPGAGQPGTRSESARESSPDADDSAPNFQRTGHPVRDRLLAKAAQAANGQTTAAPEVKAPEAASFESAAEPAKTRLDGFSALDEVSLELDELAGPLSAPRPQGVRLGGATLSPVAVLAFTTLVGLAAVASLFTLLIQLAPQEASPEQAASAPLLQSTASVSATSTTQEAAVAAPPRKKVKGPWRIGKAKTGQRVIQGKIGQEPFLRAIQNAGLPKDQAYRVLTALKDEKNLDRCRPSDEFVALVDRGTSRVLAFEYIASREEVYQAVEKDGLLRGKRLDMQVQKHRVQGAIVMRTSSFSQAAKQANFHPSIARVLNEALDGHMTVDDFSAGDRLRLVVQEKTILGDFYRYTGVEALEYLPREGSPLRIYYHPTRKRYYDARGRSPGEGGWRKPVKGAPITSKFNPNRMHPILKKRMPHNGTDFGAPTGTPIGASSPGKIIKLGNYGPNGNFIAIEHRNGYQTGYSHLSRFEKGLKVGDQVKRMQIIGYVGSTGRSTGPHLHFSAKKDGKFIDAESLQLDALTVLPKAERDKFRPVRNNYDALLDSVPLPAAPQIAQAPAAQTQVPNGMTAIQSAETQSSPAAPAAPALMPVEPPRVAQPQAVPQAPAAPTQATPATPVAAPVATAVTPQAPRGQLYLSDEELMKMQTVTDDGEVDE